MTRTEKKIVLEAIQIIAVCLDEKPPDTKTIRQQARLILSNTKKEAPDDPR